ncbi:multidrug transporter subunit MdtN [Acuticoccus mangrovi]|uniref:Multidrug transporter subunit MdtN n=1 Tax=Acuticoccus mangrovi TaxID=2796142 RepID=A0A934ITS6_9HYPH|nr:multidrug transporter subunit MdtN [Acuticoccus mangrovi]MBJ3778463.1 multidrug transporter subunit MdtN [Acuticoccus mangrovi]
MSAHHIHPARVGGAIVAIGIVVAAGLLGWRHMRIAGLHPLSQEAVLTAPVVHVAATVSGRIVELAVKENAAVKRGDVLFRVDPEPYRLAVNQVASDLAMAQAALADRHREIRAERENAAIAASQVARAVENLSLATQTLDRLLPLRPKGYVSAQEVDTAATAKRDAEISLREAQRQAAAADALVGNPAAAEALVTAREAALAIAEHALDGTVVRAPHDGRVVGLAIAAGEFVLPGQSIFTLIDTSDWYASATFVETELDRIAAGRCATVFVLSDRRTPIRGRVEGIGWGVVSEQTVNIPYNLPLVPRSLDWVRVAQRFPVRIRLEDPPEALMRVGASATVTVHDDTRC